MNDKIKIGIVGVAHMGQTRRRQLLHSKRFEIVALCDIDAKALGIAAKEDNAIAYDSFEKLLADVNVEAVAINTPIHCHAEQTVAALNAGKDVLVEKPISNSLEDAVKMIKTATQKGKKLMVAHNQKFDPMFAVIKHYIEDERLGKVCAIRTIGASSSGLAQSEGAWRTIAELNPGGPLLQCGCHIIDTIMWLFGRFDNLHARIRTDITSGDVIDCLSMLGILENGILVTVDEYYTTAYHHEFNVYGTKANLYCDTFRRKLYYQQCGLGHVETAEPIDVPVLPQLSEEWTDVVNRFYDSIKHDWLSNPNIAPEEALEVLSVVLTAHRSAFENRAISVCHADEILSKCM